MKTLLLLRHAKSSWDDPSLADHDRPLAPRGIRAAAAISEHLQSQGIEPDVVLCSTSERTRQTLDGIREAVGDAEVSFEPDLYGASTGTFFDLVYGLPAEAVSAMLISHNPGIEWFASELCSTGDDLGLMRAKYPTAGLAVIELGVEAWTEVTPASGRLAAFTRPRDLS